MTDEALTLERACYEASSPGIDVHPTTFVNAFTEEAADVAAYQEVDAAMYYQVANSGCLSQRDLP